MTSKKIQCVFQLNWISAQSRHSKKSNMAVKIRDHSQLGTGDRCLCLGIGLFHRFWFISEVSKSFQKFPNRFQNIFPNSDIAYIIGFQVDLTIFCFNTTFFLLYMLMKCILLGLHVQNFYCYINCYICTNINYLTYK